MTTTLIIISSLILLIYIGLVIIRFGIPDSISESYYLFPSKSKILFTITMYAVMFTAIIPAIEGISDDYRFVVFIMCMSLGFIGAAPAFRTGLDRKVHLISAAILLVLAELYMCVFSPYWYIAVVGLLIVAYPLAEDVIHKRQKWLFWLELAIAFPLLASILLNII